jgi:uncharacterized membrane protein YpjA
MNTTRMLRYGLLAWLLPFVVSFPLFSLLTTNRALFDSIMSVTVAITAVACAIHFVKPLTRFSRLEAVLVGFVWVLVNIVLDMLFFGWGPMRMSLGTYLGDIGLVYLAYPVVLLGAAALLEPRREVGSEAANKALRG